MRLVRRYAFNLSGIADDHPLNALRQTPLKPVGRAAVDASRRGHAVLRGLTSGPGRRASAATHAGYEGGWAAGHERVVAQSASAVI